MLKGGLVSGYWVLNTAFLTRTVTCSNMCKLKVLSGT